MTQRTGVMSHWIRRIEPIASETMGRASFGWGFRESSSVALTHSGVRGTTPQDSTQLAWLKQQSIHPAQRDGCVRCRPDRPCNRPQTPPLGTRGSTHEPRRRAGSTRPSQTLGRLGQPRSIPSNRLEADSPVHRCPQPTQQGLRRDHRRRPIQHPHCSRRIDPFGLASVPGRPTRSAVHFLGSIVANTARRADKK